MEDSEHIPALNYLFVLFIVWAMLFVLRAVSLIGDIFTDNFKELLVDLEVEKSEFGFEEFEEAYEEELEEVLEDKIELAHEAALEVLAIREENLSP
jgi:hypothetical protein